MYRNSTAVNHLAWIRRVLSRPYASLAFLLLVSMLLVVSGCGAPQASEQPSPPAEAEEPAANEEAEEAAEEELTSPPEEPAVTEEPSPTTAAEIPTAPEPNETEAPAAESATEDAADTLLTDPFLQLPTVDTVRVVWFTQFEGSEHTLTYTPTNGVAVTVPATTTQITSLYDDEDSQLRNQSYTDITMRDVWRHEAIATDLEAGVRFPYMVMSMNDDDETIASDEFTLQPLPAPGQGLTILLTSDQQNRQMSAANFQKVIETVGPVDAVFFAGDLVDDPHRASEWFDRFDEAWLENPEEEGKPAYPSARPAFFPALQGNFHDLLPEFPYTGGEILQNAPLFAAVGNHEVIGRWRPDELTLDQIYNDPQPRWYAEMRYEEVQEEVNPTADPEIREQWITDNSFSYDAYMDIWSQPDDGPQGEQYYAYQIGDVFLISMDVSRIWRGWEVKPDSRSKFTEPVENLTDPYTWGFGEFLFERFDAESEQYAWLQNVLQSEEFQNAPYKVVMAHQTMFGLGDNGVPVLTDPVMYLAYEENGTTTTISRTMPIDTATWEAEITPVLSATTAITYDYPLENDIWKNDIEPLLLENGVQLVYAGHSHLWNRTVVDGMHYLESSNVGNTFGAGYTDSVGTTGVRASWVETFWEEIDSPGSRWDKANYPQTGEPHGREPVFPTEFNPMEELEPLEEDNRTLPFVSSNNLTVFSILDTSTGTVSSYVFDTRDPQSEVRKFDEFPLGGE